MPFGQTLRTAREAKGLTASELAARTHLLVQSVEGLENEDFRRIPAPIYGRGFVKLYCETVGLDPKPLQAEFMSLYTLGRKAPPPAVKPPPAVEPPPAAEPEPPPAVEPEPPIPEPPPIVEPEPPPVVEPEPPIPEPPPVVEPEPPALEPAPASAPAPQTEPQKVVSELPPRRSYGDLFEQAYAQPEPPKPSAADKFRDTMSNVSHGVFANVKKLPPNTGRIVTVSLSALLLLALIGWGISALYKATTPQPSTSTRQAPAVTPAKPDVSPSKTPEKPKAPSAKPPAQPEAAPTKDTVPPKRTAVRGDGKTADVQPGELKASGVQIPSLYID